MHLSTKYAYITAVTDITASPTTASIEAIGPHEATRHQYPSSSSTIKWKNQYCIIVLSDITATRPPAAVFPLSD